MLSKNYDDCKFNFGQMFVMTNESGDTKRFDQFANTLYDNTTLYVLCCSDGTDCAFYLLNVLWGSKLSAPRKCSSKSIVTGKEMREYCSSTCFAGFTMEPVSRVEITVEAMPPPVVSRKSYTVGKTYGRI